MGALVVVHRPAREERLEAGAVPALDRRAALRPPDQPRVALEGVEARALLRRPERRGGRADPDELLVGEARHRAEAVVDLDRGAVAEDDEAVLHGGHERPGPAALPAQRVLERALGLQVVQGQRAGDRRAPDGRGVDLEVAADRGQAAAQAGVAHVAGAARPLDVLEGQAATVVGDPDDHRVLLDGHRDVHPAGSGVLDDVHEQLADHPEDERVVVARGPGDDVGPDRQAAAPRRVLGQALERGRERHGGERLLVHRLRQGTQGLRELGELALDRADERRVVRRLREVLAGDHEPLQGIVVQRLGEALTLLPLRFRDLRGQACSTFSSRIRVRVRRHETGTPEPVVEPHHRRSWSTSHPLIGPERTNDGSHAADR